MTVDKCWGSFVCWEIELDVVGFPFWHMGFLIFTFGIRFERANLVYLLVMSLLGFKSVVWSFFSLQFSFVLFFRYK